MRWLPEITDWRARLRSLPIDEAVWPSAVSLANARIDFSQTNALDERIRRVFVDTPPRDIGTKPVRLAVLGTSTTSHLHAGIRVAGLRRNIYIATYENAFGQYLQELLDTSSPLYAFRPTAVLFAFDAHHVTKALQAAMSEVAVLCSICHKQSKA